MKKSDFIIKASITLIIIGLCFLADRMAAYITFRSANIPPSNRLAIYHSLREGIGELGLGILTLLHRSLLVRGLKYVVHLWSEKLEQFFERKSWWSSILNIYVVVIGFILLSVGLFMCIRSIIIILT